MCLCFNTAMSIFAGVLPKQHDMILSIIRSDLRDLKVFLYNWFAYRRQSFKMSLAMKMADIKQKAWNKQYHVVLLELPAEDKLVTINREDFFRFKRKKWLPKQIGWSDFLRSSAFYSTPLSRNNKVSKAERKAAKDKYMKYAKKYMKQF